MRGLSNFREEFVYRLLRPDENPHLDITVKPLHYDVSIGDHIEFGLSDPTQFISTSESFRRTQDWIYKSTSKCPPIYHSYGSRTTIVKISINFLKSYHPQVADSAFDFTDEHNREWFLENVKQRRFAASYREVVFVYRIPKEAIFDIHVEGRGWISQHRGWMSQHRGWLSHQMEWVPQEWMMRHRGWIPQGWMPQEWMPHHREWVPQSQSNMHMHTPKRSKLLPKINLRSKLRRATRVLFDEPIKRAPPRNLKKSKIKSKMQELFKLKFIKKNLANLFF